jgi:hypothetical protein
VDAQNSHVLVARPALGQSSPRSFFISGACSSTHKNNTQNLSALLQKTLRVSSILAPRGANKKTSGE